MIKFVYFDIGGTAILDFSGTDSWKKLKAEIGIKEQDFLEFDKYWKRVEQDINTSLKVDDLKPAIEEKFKSKFPQDYSFLIDGFVNRFKKNKSIWKVIYAAQKTSKIGLLTNMYPNMLDEIKKANILPNVAWDAIVDSSVELVQKPDSEIYKIAEEKCGFGDSEIFFIDNNKANIVAAEKFGWKTFFYDPKNPKESSDELLNYYNQL